MKRKLLFVVALAASALGFNAHAQTDVTETYIENADLSKDVTEQGNGWTCDNRQGYGKATDDEHVNVVEFYSGWDAFNVSEFSIWQSLTDLPAGEYRIAVNAFYRNDGQGDGTNNDKAYIYVGENKQTVLPFAPGTLDNYNGGSDLWKASNALKQGNYLNSLYFTHEGGDITIGFKGTFDVMRAWAVLGPVKLYKYDTLDGYVTDYNAKVAEAEKLYGSKMDAGVLTTLKNAASVDVASYETSKSILEAIQNLIEAISQAEISIANYKNQKVAIDALYALAKSTNVYTAEAYDEFMKMVDGYKAAFDAGTLTGVVNPDKVADWHSANDFDDLLLSAWTIGGKQAKDFDTALYINTWSTEGDNDGTNFRVPFFEYWTNDDKSLGANKLSATVKGLDAGAYEVSAWVRVRAKNGTSAADANGVTLSVNEGTAVDVTEGKTTGSFNLEEYKAIGTVGEDGDLVITFDVAADNNISWLSFKNVKYTKLATDITDDYLVNPSFEILKAQDGNADVAVKTTLENGLFGWEVPSMSNYQVESVASGSGSGFVAQNDGPINPSDGTYYYFNRQGWGNLDSELKTTTKKAVEPGKYYLVFDYKAADYSNNNNTGNNGTTIGVTVTDQDGKVFGKTNAERRSFSLANNGSNPQNNPYMQTAPWTQLGVYFEVEEASVLTFAVQQNMRNFGRSDIIYDNFKLYQIDGAGNTDMTGLIANPSFEAGLIDGWVNSGTQSLAAQGNSSFAKVDNYYAERWHANGTLNFKQTITGLPSGKYSISATVYSEPEGTRLIANDKSTPVKATQGATDPSQVNVYSVEDVEVIDGNLVFGIEGTLTSTTWICVDDFHLTFVREFTDEDLKEKLYAEMLKASEVDFSAAVNVGSKVFQIPENAQELLTTAINEAKDLYGKTGVTLEEINAAILALQKAETPLNAPNEDIPYTITLTEGNDKIEGHAVEFVKGVQTAAQGTYAVQYNRAYNVNLASQHFYFKAVEGVNLYNIWFVDNDGEERYICDGTVTGAGTGAFGIRTTTDPEKALPVKVIASETDGITYMINTKADNGNGRHLGSNGDRGMYSWEKLNENFYKNFSIKEAETATVDAETATLAPGKFATRIYPFVPQISGVKFYSCGTVEGSYLTLEEEKAPKANVPYILYNDGEEAVSIAASGYGTLYVPAVETSNTDAPVVATTVTADDGLLTGVYSEVTVEAGNYVLQTQSGKQGFYQIAEGSSIDAIPYRCYLTLPKTPETPGDENHIKAYYFRFGDDDATAIESVVEIAEEEGAAPVFYNLSGQRVNNPTKGIYIVNGKKVLVK